MRPFLVKVFTIAPLYIDKGIPCSGARSTVNETFQTAKVKCIYSPLVRANEAVVWLVPMV